jgi:hypothetical protein
MKFSCTAAGAQKQAVTIGASAAIITFRGSPRELPKGEYGFTVFLPARNRTSWSFFPIGGMLTVVVVPDAALWRA